MQDEQPEDQIPQEFIANWYGFDKQGGTGTQCLDRFSGTVGDALDRARDRNLLYVVPNVMTAEQRTAAQAYRDRTRKDAANEEGGDPL